MCSRANGKILYFSSRPFFLKGKQNNYDRVTTPESVFIPLNLIFCICFFLDIAYYRRRQEKKMSSGHIGTVKIQISQQHHTACSGPFYIRYILQYPMILQADSEGRDQTARMIWAFIVRAGFGARFCMAFLIWSNLLCVSKLNC